MKKADFVAALAEGCDVSKAKAGEMIDKYHELVTQACQEDKSMQFIGFGTYELRERSARKGRNPQTGAEIEIAAKKSIGLKIGKATSEKLNG